MKRAIIIFVVIVSGLIHNGNIYSQSGRIKKANKNFQNYSYAQAAERYTAAGVSQIELVRRQAESYRLIGEFAKSDDLYSKIVQNDACTAEDNYNYSLVLKALKKYKEANVQLDIFSKKSPADSRVKEYLGQKTYYDILSRDNNRYNIKSLKINSSAQDFAPAYYGNKIVFASSRTKLSFAKRVYNRNNKPFLNIYLSNINDQAELGNSKQFKKKFNKKYHEGTACFARDNKLMAFTRDNYKMKSSNGIRNLEIYFSEYVDGKWGNPYAFTYNNKEYSVGQPYLSDDGNTLYFVSDKPGGFGGTDIYRCQRNGNTWAEPENLGSKINTEGNEMFPFITIDGNLIFSSDGHLGLGGLDLFITDKNMKSIKNMEFPLNSNMDDFALILDKNMKSGYFSSNREGGQGDDDIYAFDYLKKITFGKTIKGTAFDKNGKILANTSVILLDDKGDKLTSVVVGTDGKYSFSVEDGKIYKLLGTLPKYSDGKNTASTKSDESEIIADVVLEYNPGISLYLLITDSKSKQSIQNVTVTFIDNLTGKKEIISTSSLGDYRWILSDKKVGDKCNYSFTLAKDGYFTKTVNYLNTFKEAKQYNLHEVFDFTMDQEVKDLAELVQINPINFDFNKYNIRPDAAVELDKIVEIMNKYPNMVVELGSHTDCRGSIAYNEKLSDNRAKASAAYIKAKISNPGRIYGKGYGESKPLNGCVCEGTVKSTCTDEEFAVNRRTEFKVISTGNDKVKIQNNSTNSFGN